MEISKKTLKYLLGQFVILFIIASLILLIILLVFTV